jgi:hypothetical protein
VHKHEGTFAVGQEISEHHPELAGERGDFASGMERVRYVRHGTFAAGQEHADPHPELIENRLGFAAGQRTIRFIPSYR